MKITVKAYNEETDEFTIETENAIFDDIEASYIQLSEHENAEEPTDMIDREIVASAELEQLLISCLEEYKAS